MKSLRNTKGFTLVEIIVVLVIMVIMAAIAVPAVTGYITDAENSKYVQTAGSIYTVVQTEEAAAKAKGASVDYTAIAETVKDKVDGLKNDTVTIIKSENGKYTFTFSGKTVTFTPNTNDMKVTDASTAGGN